MIGVSPRRTTGRFPATRPSIGWLAGLVLAASPLVPGLVSAQSTGTDLPSLPASPDATPPPSVDTNPPLGPYAPSNNAASPLLPASPPLPPHPSIPSASYMPDSTPPPAGRLPLLPVPGQTGTPDSPAVSGAAPASGAAGTTPAASLLPGGGDSATANSASVRRFQYAFRLSTGVNYDDNVFLVGSSPVANRSSGRSSPRGDTYFYIDPSVSLGYGDFLSRVTNYLEFDYSLDARLYTTNTNLDAVQHYINLQGAYHFAQVTLTLTQGVQILDSTDVGSGGAGGLLGSTAAAGGTGAQTGQVNLDASQRTGLTVYSTAVSANYAFSDKTSFDLSGYFSANEYASLISSESLGASAYFNYSPTGKITLGLGVTGGYVIQDDPAPEEYFQQLNLRLSYFATSKISVAGSVGIEARETSGSGGNTSVTPVFDLSVTYAPFDSTTLSLAANRQVGTSAVLTGQNFDTTGFTLTISQRLYQKVSARLALGYTHSSYVDSGRGVATNRNDDYYFVQPSLDYSIRGNLSAGIFYIRRQNNSSSLTSSGFSDNQIGARVSFNF